MKLLASKYWIRVAALSILLCLFSLHAIPALAQSASDGSSNFVPLTQLPGIQDAASSATLSSFLNQVYKICIGISAVLAVLMIMYAGVEFMTDKGSVTGNEKAKARIQNAILGLILVLSPTIVFSIINPDILNLNINFDSLQPDALKQLSTGKGDDAASGGGFGSLWEAKNSPDKKIDARRCDLSNGTVSYSCKKKDGTSPRTVSSTDTCNTDEDSFITCTSKSAQPTSAAQCTEKYTSITSITMNSAPNICNASEGYVPVSHGCCVAAANGNLCCAKPKGTEFLLAYHYSQTPKQGTTDNIPSCTQYPTPKYYSTAAQCSAEIPTIETLTKIGASNTSYSGLTFSQKCVAVTDKSFKQPEDPKACK